MQNNRIKSSKILLSIVVPLFNEEANVDPLLKNIQTAMMHYKQSWELIVVDDGSSDNTMQNLERAVSQFNSGIKIIQLQRNFGQTAAMQAGIDHALGQVIVTLDGDLQNDPKDIPDMVSYLLDNNLDLVVGWRRSRKDSFVRIIPSWIANRLIGYVTGVKLHDYGCSLKSYRASVIKPVRLYGEMHRFIPAWIATATSLSRVDEMVVRHYPRKYGSSKYGLSRTFRVVLDLLSIYFFMRFKSKPGHFFGAIGLILGFLGGIILTYLAIVKFVYGEDIGTRPLLLVGVVLVISSIQLFTTGVISELLSRTYFESAKAKPYVIRDTIEKKKDEYETS